jgi:hypothetical protein
MRKMGFLRAYNNVDRSYFLGHEKPGQNPGKN